jgi:hypothetical protein
MSSLRAQLCLTRAQGFAPAELMLCSALFDGIGIAQVAPACISLPGTDVHDLL